MVVSHKISLYKLLGLVVPELNYNYMYESHITKKGPCTTNYLPWLIISLVFQTGIIHIHAHP